MLTTELSHSLGSRQDRDSSRLGTRRKQCWWHENKRSMVHSMGTELLTFWGWEGALWRKDLCASSFSRSRELPSHGSEMCVLQGTAHLLTDYWK